jgi:hypothetical protein
MRCEFTPLSDPFSKKDLWAVRRPPSNLPPSWIARSFSPSTAIDGSHQSWTPMLPAAVNVVKPFGTYNINRPERADRARTIEYVCFARAKVPHFTCQSNS